jgi:drug/metabolite transporter (DMT)-like permease
MKPHHDRVPAGSIALLLVIGLGWGTNWPFIRIAVEEIPPWTFRSICMVGGGALLMIAAWAQSRDILVPRREFWALAVTCFFNITCYQILVAFGLAQMEAGRGSILGFTFPLWTVLFGRAILGERLTPSRWVALGLGLAAMLLLIIPDAQKLGRAPWGALLIIASAITWSFGTVLFKKFTWSMPPLNLTAWQICLGGMPIVAGALLFDSWSTLPAPSMDATMATAYSVLIGIFLCQWLWYRTLSSLPAGVATIAILSVPVVGVITSAWMLGERIGPLDLIALVLVMASLLLVLVGPQAFVRLARRPRHT